jgi:pyruvate dehydrogenase E1 component alpha subunit
MPVHHSAAWLKLVSISSPVGTQIPQAVGAAYAAKVMGKDDVTMVYFGEGTSSTGEFHVGMNFAGVWKAPCIFLCRNNGWAISVPKEKQTAAKTFAAKAVGYGMPGVRVDGNDLLAVWSAASEAIERARAGEGPTLIEALTYRVQGHSSSDDPSVYRDPKEPEVWEKKDPIARLRAYMRSRSLWTEAWEKELSERYNQEITDALAAADHKQAPAVETMFDDVYEQLPWNLREQRAYLMAQARTKNPHHHG